MMNAEELELYAHCAERAEAAEARAAQAEAKLTAAVLPVAELVARANEAEAKAAQAEAKLHLAHVESQSAWDSEAQWKAAANRLEREVIDMTQKRDTWYAEVAAHRAQQAEIRKLVNAYPEHDTLEAVRRAVELLHSARAERDGWVKVVKSALDAAGISYGLTFDDAVKTLVHQRDAARRELIETKATLALHAASDWDACAELRSERDAAGRELQHIRTLIDADDDESTLDEVAGKVNQLKQANERIGQLEANRDELAHKIDALIKVSP